MNSPLRQIHDAATMLKMQLGARIEPCTTYGINARTPRRRVQTGGAQRLDNSFDESFGGLPSKYLLHEWDHHDCFFLDDVSLTSDQGVVFLNDGRLFLPSLNPYYHDWKNRKIRLPIRTLSRTLKTPAFHLTGRNHENRGHFLQDHLPRLMASRALLEEHYDARILVAPGHARWQKNFITALGFPEERIVEGSQGTLRVKKLFFTPVMRRSISTYAAPETYKSIRETLAATLKIAPAAPIRAIFLSRKDAPNRRLANEEEVVQRCKEFLGDIEVLTLSRMTLAEQVQKFSQAEIIIGPIGQAISNILMVTGKLLITLIPGKRERNAYGENHSYITLISGNRSLTFYNNVEEKNADDWHFPMQRFDELLKRASEMGAFTK